MRAFEAALWNAPAWQDFEREVRRSTPSLPGMERWLDRYADAVRTQLLSPRVGPRSTGAVEAVLQRVERDFDGRWQSFGNRARLDKLLALMTLAANARADARLLADRLRERLHPLDGIAPQQRPHDDAKGLPSLLG